MAFLLDTCALMWMAGGRLEPDLVEQLEPAIAIGEGYFSPISAWEIAMLGRPRANGPRVRFDPDPVVWFERFRASNGLREFRLSADIAAAAAMLPNEIHPDPADRFLIASARQRGMPLVTSDRKIIGYGMQGLLDVIACRPVPEMPA